MRRGIAICSGVGPCLFFGFATASASPRPNLRGQMGGQGRGSDGRGHGRDQHGNNHVKVAFSIHDREVTRNYFREHPSQLPPGLAKCGGNLPPGVEKQLQEGGTMPPGCQKRLRPCPVQFTRRLPPLAEGYLRKMLGTRLLILDSMNVIPDIMILSREVPLEKQYPQGMFI